jgi:hypothetical protein
MAGRLNGGGMDAGGLNGYSTDTWGTLLPVVGLLTPPILSVMGSASPLM